MSKHDASAQRREAARRIERSAAAAKLLTVTGRPVRVILPDGRKLETFTAGLPWMAANGVWWVNVILSTGAQGCPCQAVSPIGVSGDTSRAPVAAGDARESEAAR